MKPISRFKIFPENRSLYYLVFVWRTLKDLRGANPGNSHALGLCRSYRTLRCYRHGDKRGDLMKPVLGEIHLCRHHLRAGVIVHELTHALFGWMSERNVVVDMSNARNRKTGGTLKHSSPEEIACHAMGEMFRQTCVALTVRKLI